mgnify:CR=1 FL=1
MKWFNRYPPFVQIKIKELSGVQSVEQNPSKVSRRSGKMTL